MSGTWMQRTAQDWLVLTQLTHNNATAVEGALALGLGILTVTGVVRLWHVYLFAFLLGCVAAFDSPARRRQPVECRGATSFNLARTIGPAVAGILIAAVGTGWVFLINAGSFGAVLCSLRFLRVDELHRSSKPLRSRGIPQPRLESAIWRSGDPERQAVKKYQRLASSQ